MPGPGSEGVRRSRAGGGGDGERRGPPSPRGAERLRLVVRYLSIARYASTEQIHRLLGGRPRRETLGRWLTRLSIRDRRRRRAAHLTRLEYRRRDGSAVPVWALSPSGAALASELGPALSQRAERRVGHQFLEHTLLLNEVLLDLVLRSGGGEDPLSRLPFHWQGEGKDALEFQVFDRQRVAPVRAAVRPDAVLTVPGRRRRLFLEAETGTQSIATGQARRTGAVLAKLDRYASYFVSPSGRGAATTFYLRDFPDGYAPRLIFLVRSEARRDRVRRALSAFFGPLAPGQYRVVVLTFGEAGAALANYFPPPGPGDGGREPRLLRVEAASARRLGAACAALCGAVAEARRAIREHNAATGCRLALPPARAEEARLLRDFVDLELLGRPGPG